MHFNRLYDTSINRTLTTEEVIKKKNLVLDGMWQLMPVIPSTWEAETGGLPRLLD